MKFGGTSVRDGKSRTAAMRHVRRNLEAGYRVTVVVSAMGRKGEPYATDTLIGLLRSAGEPVSPRELDLVMSTGELLSAAFFAQLLTADGVPAQAFSGPQAGILTDSQVGAAEILEIKPDRIREAMSGGNVAVVAGFQGADGRGEILTLGRGGSDTSAVALGAALDAELVEIYSDVDGIACADPRRIAEAPFMTEIGATQIMSMADEGSGVLHPRAVAAAVPKGISIRARSTFSDMPGTLVHHRPALGDSLPVALAHRDNQVLLSLPAGAEACVPELLDIGKGRYLLLDDVYLEERVAVLRERFGDPKPESGWATASLIYSGDAPASGEVPQDGELIPAPADRRRYLVRADRLTGLLNTLFRSDLT
ncbi:MAG: aspartate kinase [bacterium]|nr:aspartate kinase [bacterium]